MLICYRWNVENLFCALTKKDIDLIFLEIGLPPHDTKDTITNNTIQFIKYRTCLEEVAIIAAIQIDCWPFATNVGLNILQ